MSGRICLKAGPAQASDLPCGQGAGQAQDAGLALSGDIDLQSFHQATASDPVLLASEGVTTIENLFGIKIAILVLAVTGGGGHLRLVRRRDQIRNQLR